MHQERKRKRTLRVKRMFEPDRISLINLQVTYERVVPTHQYRILSAEQISEKQELILSSVEEVSA